LSLRRENVLRGAGAVIALALLVFAIADWIPSGFIYAIVFAMVVTQTASQLPYHLRQPPSLERFKKLWGLVSTIVIVCCVGAFMIFISLPLDVDLRFRVSLVVGFAIAAAIGAVACSIWYYWAVRSYDRWRPRNPDFAEDEEGNPERATPPPP
jgi:hypothetical protein